MAVNKREGLEQEPCNIQVIVGDNEYIHFIDKGNNCFDVCVSQCMSHLHMIVSPEHMIVSPEHMILSPEHMIVSPEHMSINVDDHVANDCKSLE